MATKALMSAEDYLAMSFPDMEAEFVHGELEERSMPDYIHSAIQGYLIVLLAALKKTHQLFVCPELRVQPAQGIYRLIDVCLFTDRPPQDRVPTEPPLVAIEIVSKDDRYVRILEKLKEYRAWGVTHIWLVDPRLKELSVYTNVGLQQVPSLSLPEYGFEITMPQLLEGL